MPYNQLQGPCVSNSIWRSGLTVRQLLHGALECTPRRVAVFFLCEHPTFAFVPLLHSRHTLLHKILAVLSVVKFCFTMNNARNLDQFPQDECASYRYVHMAIIPAMFWRSFFLNWIRSLFHLHPKLKWYGHSKNLQNSFVLLMA